MKKYRFAGCVLAAVLCIMMMLPAGAVYAEENEVSVSDYATDNSTDTQFGAESTADSEQMEQSSIVDKEDSIPDTTGDETVTEEPEISSDADQDYLPDVVLEESAPSVETEDVSENKFSVEYRSHIQRIGWESEWVSDGEMSGTSGKSLRLEAVQIKLENAPAEGSIEYMTHIQNLGWEEQWRTDGASSGTDGQSLRLEAIRIRLTGALAEQYDIYYRVHAQQYGWLGWAKNGESAGTQGYAYRLEALEIKLVEKNGQAPGETENAFVKSYVRYRAHVADIGWQVYVNEGQTAGTTGKNKSVQALNINLDQPEYSGGVEYRTYVEREGWQEWAGNGGQSGTVGRNLQAERVEIRLTGEMAEQFDLYYRVHVSNLGWLGWAKNGESAGSSGRGYGIEAFEIQVVEKDGKAPGSTEGHYIESDWATSYEQRDETTVVTVIPQSLEKIKTQQMADSVTITAVMKYNGKITRTVKEEKRISSIPDSGFVMDLRTYGKFTVTAEYKKNGKVVGSDEVETAVAASEYNLAPLSATFPVVYFSLSLWDIQTSPDTGRTIPTIVMLDRPSAYNWDNLPDNVYAMPYLTESAITTSADYTTFAQYVKDLYEISPDAKFHLYINDITCSLIHWIIYANKIPQGQYNITMLSDGSATYSIMNDTYSGADPAAKHQELIQTWEQGKQEAYQTGKYGAGWGWHTHWDCMYAVLACEPGTQWWVARNNLFTSGDGNVFADQLKNDVQVVNVNTLLQELSGKGEATVEAFKSLYNFNDGYFSNAEEQGKQAMVLLGTYVYNEQNFADYARLTRLYYGDDYLYYYKGHPNTPTGLYEEKQKQLEELGITDVDSAIAAELILFFNPEISLSGYGSSTFNSASDEMACGLFNATKEASLAEGSTVNYTGIDWFASLIQEGVSKPEIVSLCKEGHVNYLVEFSDAIIESEAYDVGIFDASAGVLKLYKQNADGTYIEVEKKSEGNGVTYSSHVQNYGWLSTVKEGAVSGTEGEGKRLEAFRINLGELDYDGTVEYRAHVADIGWQDWVKEGENAGTENKAKAVEAISIRLTGEVADHYDIYYQVHAQNLGWMDWAKNGENAGTEGFSYRLEAIRIRLVEKGGEAPGSTAEPFKKSQLRYQGHVSNIGWQSWVSEGQMTGTTGRKLGMEAICIRLNDPQYSGAISYRAHVSGIGWQTGWRSNGAMAGTTSQKRTIEALQIKLTGEMADHYDVYYRVHSQDYGWLGWAKNGESSGTSGLSKRIEAAEICLVEKGGRAPGSTTRPFVSK